MGEESLHRRWSERDGGVHGAVRWDLRPRWLHLEDVANSGGGSRMHLFDGEADVTGHLLGVRDAETSASLRPDDHVAEDEAVLLFAVDPSSFELRKNGSFWRIETQARISSKQRVKHMQRGCSGS